MKKQEAILGILFFLVFLILGCSSPAKKPTIETTAEVGFQKDTARQVVIQLSQDGSLRTQISGDIMVRETNNNKPASMAMYNHVVIEFFDSTHKVVNKVTAKKGIYDEIKKTVWLEDSVHVSNYKQETLETNKLSWADSTHEFYTDQKVLINTHQQQIEGVGLTAAEDFSRYKIHQLKGVIMVSNQELP